MATKIEALRAKMNELRERHSPGLKTSGISFGAGAAGNVAFGVLSDRVGVLQSAWYYEPLLLAIVGHLAKKKNSEAGAGLLGAAGYAFAQNSRLGVAVRGGVAQALPSAKGADAASAMSEGQMANAIAGAIAREVAQRMIPQQAGYGGYGGGWDASGTIEAQGFVESDASGL